MFSFHMVPLGARAAIGRIRQPPRPPATTGLRHAECFTPAPLGGRMSSPPRFQLSRFTMFAEWEDEAALDGFLAGDPLGRLLADGWHVRLEPLRVYGHWPPMPDLPTRALPADPDEPMVAVTIARTRLSQLPRFLRASNPAENEAVNHPASLFATAIVRPPRTVATFSVWRSLQEMTDFARGRAGGDHAGAHLAAIREQRRKDFHLDSAFARFRPIAEHGEWDGRRLVPR